MNINMKHLTTTLRRAKKCTPPQATTFHGEVNQYLFDHYLTSFMNGMTPTVGDLDFSQFSLEDVHEFGRYLESASQTNAKLISFLNQFNKAEPVAQQRRVYC